MTVNPDILPYVLVGFVAVITLVLWFLSAMFAREAVKRDLRERICTPRHIWWCPMAYWNTSWWGTPFRVIYLDPEERLHKAYCSVYTALNDSPFGTRRVEWIKDELRDFIDV